MIKLGFIKVSFKDIQNNDYSLSASLYQGSEVNYSFYKKLSEFIVSTQKGNEPGSKFYTEDKTFRFIRTSNIDENSFLLNEDLCIGIANKVFKEHKLEKEQILMVKDATLGKVAMLDKDYPNYMLCGGIHSLTCDFPYYLFAILQHSCFKENFEKKIPRGSTFRHAGDRYLDFDVPLPNDNNEEVITFVENLMRSAFLKEVLIKEKISQINQLIYCELNFEGFDDINNQKFPRIKEISVKNKLYAGYYSKKTKFIKDLIFSYKKGYFFIDKKNIKSGFTPSKKIGPVEDNSLKFNWITPTNINELGIVYLPSSIEFDYKKNNLKKNACLIINRTSKKVNGESGKFVGISSFYDIGLFNEGQHNQGIYRVENYDDIDLIVLVSLLNHPLYRELFGEISLGSKMKEIKIEDLINIPFPNFDLSLKKKIKDLYVTREKYDFVNLNNENFLEKDSVWCKKVGVLDLYIYLQRQKTFINHIVNMIYEGEDIKIDYSF